MASMKIGIITILKVNNYGAELQAYATQTILNKLGYNAEIIDYLFYKNKGFKKTKRSHPSIQFPLKKRILETIFPIFNKIKSLPYRKIISLREKKFNDFHLHNTLLSKTYKSVDQLYKECQNYDVYMSGSDQIWNPYIYSSLDPYFLDFAPEGKRRIAYGSSFGVSSIPEYAKNYYKEHLLKYHAIGVREQNAVEIVHQLCGKKAQWVLDPTMLLDATDWMKVSATPDIALPEKYILIYELTTCPYILKLAKYISNIKGMPIIRLCKSVVPEDKDTNITDITDAGPAEFISLFHGASYIVTNSFHGAAFSINFNKQFYVITPARKTNNSRQRSILKLFNIENRLLEENSPLPEIIDISYQNVNNILFSEREKSIKFLTEAIND